MKSGTKRIAALLALVLTLSLGLTWSGNALAEEPSTEVNRFNVVLVIDKSGSLRDAMGVGTDPHGLRFDAMRLFLGLLTESGNHVGAVVFDEDVRYDSGLLPMDSMADKKALIREVEYFTPGLDTDIGRAVQRATELLQGMQEENGLPCMILLLTDGQTDFTTGGVQERKRASWAVGKQALTTAQAEGITINGILLNVDGKAADGEREFRVYTQGTGGTFEEVGRPEDLAAAFQHFYSIINNTVYTGAQRVAFSDRGEAEIFFTVPSFGVEEVNLVVEHETAPGGAALEERLDLGITRPDGEAYDYADHALTSSRYMLVKLPHPAVGEWSVRLAGESEDWVDVTMVYNASMSVSLSSDRASGAYRAYSPYRFTATVSDSGVESVTREDLNSLNAVLTVEELATGDIREYEMEAGDGAYTCEASFLKNGDFRLSTRVGLGGFEVRSNPLEVTVEPWPLVARVTRITDILQYGRFRDDVWEVELDELFGIEDTSGIRYTLSEDYGGALTVEDGVLQAHFEDLDEVSFVLTASDLMGQSADITFDFKIPHVTATADSLTNDGEGNRDDGHWALELDELFTDPKDSPLSYELSDDHNGAVTITDGVLEVDLEELPEGDFTVSATDIFGAQAEIPVSILRPGPAAMVRRISETVRTGLFQTGIWERSLDTLFREPRGGTLTYALSEDYGGKVELRDGTLTVDMKGLKQVAFDVTATNEYDKSAEVSVTLTEKDMTIPYVLYGLGALLVLAMLIAFVVYLRRR